MNKNNKIISLLSTHDGGYAVLEGGIVKEHIEIERYSRVKEDGGDSWKYFNDIYLKNNNITKEYALENFDFVGVMPTKSMEKDMDKDFDIHNILPKNKIKFYSHHLCHISNSYFSSPFDNALSISIDNAGMDNDNESVSATIYICKQNQVKRIFAIPTSQFSLGNLWSRMVRYVFKLSSGRPYGNSSGTVMAMAALGDPDKYFKDLTRMMSEDHQKACMSPPGALRGVHVPPEEEVVHPYLNKYRLIAEDDQEKYNLAASLQKVTEEFIINLVKQAIEYINQSGMSKTQNICFSGGVALNSVAMGKVVEFLPKEWNVFIGPTPGDSGLTIGAAQFYYHSILGYPKTYNKDNFASPYLGELHSKDKVVDAMDKYGDQITVTASTDNEVAQLLADGKIVSVYYGRSESGRRALGNRSILANPGIPEMKKMINDKVKHRQWYRPFAPSVLDEYGDEWFENYFSSPYMGFVFKIKEDKVGKAPAIEHFDQTARIQSVSEKTNPWYYSLISKFHKITGIPLVLNTSFNDMEPIVETPSDAFKCFLGTNIDYLYFAESGELVKKNEL